MAITSAILSIGTNDAERNADRLNANVTTIINDLKSRGYTEIVVVPPNSETHSVQSTAVVNAAVAADARIVRGLFSGDVPTTESAAQIRALLPDATVIGDDVAVKINGGTQNDTAKNNLSSTGLIGVISEHFGPDRSSFYDEDYDGGYVEQTDSGAAYVAGGGVTFTDFSSMSAFNDYLDTRHHVRSEVVSQETDSGRSIVRAEMSYTVREILCAVMAGKGLKLPNIQMCLYINIQELLKLDAVTGNLRTALQNIESRMEEFIDHTNIENVLHRLNTVIGEAATVANMINFCGNPIQPKAIPNMLENVMESYLGTGEELINNLGSIAPENVCACVGTNGFNTTVFNGGVLGQISENFNDLASGSLASGTLNAFASSLNNIATDFTNLMKRETEINAAVGDGYSLGGSQFSEDTCNTALGVGHNPFSSGVGGNARIANGIRTSYDQLAGYPVIAQDGTVYDNVFELLLNDDLLNILKQINNNDSQVGTQTQVPIYDYCDNIIGYKTVVEQESETTSTGRSPTATNFPGELLTDTDRSTSSGNTASTTSSDPEEADNFISKAKLKEIAADATDFADFQSKISQL